MTISYNFIVCPNIVAGVRLMPILWQNFVWPSRNKCRNTRKDITPAWCFSNYLILLQCHQKMLNTSIEWYVISFHWSKFCSFFPMPDCNHGLHCKWTRGDGWCRLWICWWYSWKDWPLCWEGMKSFVYLTEIFF